MALASAPRAQTAATGASVPSSAPASPLALTAATCVSLLRFSMGALINQAEGDDEFWGQDAWKEVRGTAAFCLPSRPSTHKPSPPLTSQEAADEEYKSEKEEADVFDSDFGDEEVCVKNEAGSSRLLFAPFLCAPARVAHAYLRVSSERRRRRGRRPGRQTTARVFVRRRRVL